jgi:hypothetical protein
MTNNSEVQKLFLKQWPLLKFFNDAASTAEIYDTP